MKLYRLGNHSEKICVSLTDRIYEDEHKTILMETKTLIDSCPLQLWEKSKKQHNEYLTVLDALRLNPT